MSDTSLNEIQPKILKLDTPDQDTATLKKPDSIFVVPSPQSSSPNLTTVTISDSRKSSPQNKVHVIPFNLGSQKTTPIKLIKDLRPASQSNVSSSIANKKFIQFNAFSANSNTSSNLATSPIRANNIVINNSDKSPQNNAKILSISNGLSPNSSFSNSKIQYVKIVNTPSISSNSTPIKLTTITSSNGNTNNSQEGFSIRPVVSSIAPNAIKTIPKPASSPIASQTSTVSLKQSDQPGSSVLLNAMNNSPNVHEAPLVSNKTPATTTIQLVNQSQSQAQRSQLINHKTSIIQRIHSFPPNQPPVKTMASTSNESQSGQMDRSGSYKVLNQQFQNNINKSDGSNITEVKSAINSENLNVQSNSVNQSSSSVQSKSPEIESLKISTTKPKAAHQQTSPISLNQSSSSASTRKPCNCTKSMCLKLYCDCFAQGSFCHDCNCVNCFNTLDHEEERNKAIKMVLERNPQAFQSKIGKFTASLAISKAAPAQISQKPTLTSGIEDLITASATTDELDEIKSRHVKGCNCKKSNCLKRYCECFLAKIQCSALCKCVGCKNCDESTRTLLQLANAADLRKQQHQQEQKQQFIQQQQQNKQLFSPKNSQSSSNSSTKTSTNFKTKNLEILNENEQFLVEKQKLIRRAYRSAMDTSVLKETCESLMSRLVSQIESEKMHTDDEDDNDRNNLSEPMEIDMEKCLIEHFGSFLSAIIQNAETKSTSH